MESDIMDEFKESDKFIGSESVIGVIKAYHKDGYQDKREWLWFKGRRGRIRKEIDIIEWRIQSLVYDMHVHSLPQVN